MTWYCDEAAKDHSKFLSDDKSKADYSSCGERTP
jgi:hypothetical protein